MTFLWILQQEKKAINKLKNNNNYKNLSDEEQERLYKYILALEKIAENSKLLKPYEGAPNTKPKKKPMVDRYYYFSSRVKINGAYFDLVFDTEKGVDDSNKKPITVHLYNIKEADGGRGAHTHDLKMPSTSCEYTITPNSEKVNSKVQFQSSQDPRGGYHKDIIYLFEKANASTFMHETAHWFKNELQKLGTERSKEMLVKVDE